MEKRLPLLEADRALLAAFREGQPDALLTVYRAHSARIAAVLHFGLRSESGRVTGMTSPFDLENGVQEVFVRAFEPSARLAYDGIRPYEGFLVGIARNLLHERARRREVPSAAPSVEQGAAFADLPVAEEGLEDREVSRLLAAFLEGCDPGERALYELRFDQALSQEEAARGLRITRIQLRRRERRLKSRLLEFMQSHGYLTGLKEEGWGFGWLVSR